MPHAVKAAEPASPPPLGVVGTHAVTFIPNVTSLLLQYVGYLAGATTGGINWLPSEFPQPSVMSRQKELIAHLLDAFPPRAFPGEVTSHNCAECTAIRATLGGASWWSVPGSFIRQHSNHLPLLTQEAYKAFLPAWMCEAVSDPTGETAALLMVNLREGTFAPDFSQQESYAVIQVAKWIAENNGFGPEDPVNRESMARIMQKWEGQDA